MSTKNDFDRYRNMFECSNDAVILVEAGSTAIVECNKMARKLTGYTEKEILSMKIGDFIP